MTPSTDRLVAGWLRTQRSRHTRDAYARDLVAFVEWCRLHGTDPLRASLADLREFRDASLRDGLSPATVARRLAGIASFYGYATRAGALGENPAREVARPPRDAVRPATLEPAEVAALLGAGRSLGSKAAALVALLGLEGMKLGEALAIDVTGVDVGSDPVAVVVARGGAAQRLEVSEPTAAALVAHVADRRRGPLFESDSPVRSPHARLTRFGADFILKRAAAAAGIDKPVSASILRRTYVDLEHRAGTRLADISRHVGHRRPRDTVRLLEERT